MTSTYQKHAKICAKFYDLILDSKKVADFVFNITEAKAGQKALFVGGMYDVAKYLSEKGLDITCVDYSEDMIEVGKEKLPNIKMQVADLRSLPFKDEFDLVLVVGRVFTHLIADEDLIKGLNSCYNSLKTSGRAFIDNYEDTKIGKTEYFNAPVIGKSEDIFIQRDSITELISEKPYVVNWTAKYSGVISGEEFSFSDSMEHRAWSREEIHQYLDMTGFWLVDQGDNFDETSFYNIVERRAPARLLEFP